MNLANSPGAALGGTVIAVGLSYRAPAWAGAALGAVGLTPAMTSSARERRVTKSNTSMPEPVMRG